MIHMFVLKVLPLHVCDSVSCMVGVNSEMLMTICWQLVKIDLIFGIIDFYFSVCITKSQNSLMNCVLCVIGSNSDCVQMVNR